MRRHFYVSDSLDDLELVEQELENQGVDTPQFHVLSQDDAGVENRKLHTVEAVLKKDVVHSMERGAVIGIICAAVILLTSYSLGWTQSDAGWIPFIFLAIVVLGFCTWEGGLFGIQEPHYQFKQFQDTIREGKHIFFVDVTKQQEPVLEHVVSAHPTLKRAGLGEATPELVVYAQKGWRDFLKTMP